MKPAPSTHPGMKAKKNWRATFAFSRADEGFEDMIRRGRQYRRRLGRSARALK
jgi:hypothetical protein